MTQPRLGNDPRRKVWTRSNYRKALDPLLEEFNGRCAYSLVHVEAEGRSQLHVDHFDPRKKRKCTYDNLLPAWAPCNLAKSDIWPSADDEAAGMRYLNPRREPTYGHFIFEDPATHKLVGASTAARYHIRTLDLNSPALVHKRRLRAAAHVLLKHSITHRSGNWEGLDGIIDHLRRFREEARLSIPEIPPPPSTV